MKILMNIGEISLIQAHNYQAGTRRCNVRFWLYFGRDGGITLSQPCHNVVSDVVTTTKN